LTILTEVGHDVGVCAEIAHIITRIRQYERLTGECSGVGVVLHWMESAVSDVLALAAAFCASSQTAVALYQDATRLRSYVDRLRVLGFLPTNPLSIHESPAHGGGDGPGQGGAPLTPADKAGAMGATTSVHRPPSDGWSEGW
jgi:hypothetical protein